ncbi:PfaD family polyunsaturated fatty acid/polyketide biosynthesis protein [Mycobacterium sp. Aquia_213]|uniref:PfaD family polyunsaturated fatty acid/polyketide biosynthesis protein n=1 Tax=Mycobacterium sp. Aquia_213 TaxID=2991728 RepID=UPI00226E6163|nr:PfaD family polyunsaturated fatty acid/polyketide biosynthesis protein [Mycobacterium sp. Aquia_213]WAC89974.1 PfaD family polyunsaturated fatty acid/polyketide biosynthesis protein [Mycobacterium sp. Aquia_213]
MSPSLGGWRPSTAPAAFAPPDIAHILQYVRHPVHVVREDATGQLGLAMGGELVGAGGSDVSLMGTLPPIYPEWLGDREFCESHGIRFPYVTGAMANGIATPALVVAIAEAGMLGFFGAGGLSYAAVERGLADISTRLAGRNLAWGANLIHSPNEVALEGRVAELFIERGVRVVEASAFMKLTPAVVHYALSGLSTDPAGAIVRNNHVMAKISRPEVARMFMEPAPAALVSALVAAGKLTEREAELAQYVPVAEDITVEADSGGHTDNRPLPALFSEIVLLRDKLARQHGLASRIRVGAAGGLGTPQSVAGAFAMGAAYVLTGSVNQACIESGLSPHARGMLAKAGVADVMMAPASDMFEMGVNLQVLKRGAMFGPRARKLYEWYAGNPDLSAVVDKHGAELEKILGKSVGDVWAETHQYWEQRDPAVLELANRDSKYQMGLVFRWYLGKSSRWAIDGQPDRVLDYQIWCGPSMGAFNSWVAGSYLEQAEHRTVDQVALNLLEGATHISRAHQARKCGVPVPADAFNYIPRPLSL